MKGVTKLIRELGSEPVVITGTARDNIYRIARACGIRVKVEKFADGFYVTRAGDAPPVRTQTARGVIGATDTIAQERYSKIIVPDSTPALVEPESVEIVEWRFTKDAPNYADNGNVYRQQYLVSNPKKRRAVQVDPDDVETIQE